MKQLILILLYLASMFNVSSQFYLRGIVHDERGKGLYNVKIQLFSKGNYPYYTGNFGAFGIPTNLAVDTIILQTSGYETLKCAVESSKFQSLTLKMLPVTASLYKHRLSSVTKDKLDKQHDEIYYHGGESYSSLVENNFVDADKFPQTGFSMNIDMASYSNIRRFLNIDAKVPPDAVRIEEMLNYFSFPNKNTASGSFACDTKLTSCPWDVNNELLFVNLQAPSIDVSNIPPTNLIFLIDVSGSMDQENRLPLLKSAFKQLANNLRPQDSVGIVIYGGGVGVWLRPTSGAEKEKINAAIEKLEPGGETPGAAAIVTAYGLAERCFNHNANNRVILATDGDFNVGQSTEKELEDLIEKYRQSGIFLTCIGVGMGNYKDSKLEALAKRGNGNFAYVDNIHEAEKVLITEFTKTLYAVAEDCYAGVSFNPALVKSYRLIGFENKIDAITDTASELEGGEIGTGHSLMAVFEIVPTQKNIDAVSNEDKGDEIADIKLQYRLPQQSDEKHQEFKVFNDYGEIEAADSCIRFAAGVVMFGELLKQSDFAKNYDWSDVAEFSKKAANMQDFSQAEFLDLVEKARKIYDTGKRKRKRDK
ncbi:MAG TPA: von Willebrand factor type A domain-containing protein [Chitinophagaceae bacterium]|nr:von Willebrand factor type A domain-containing protein [Chitinophagaceae bacterium]